MQTAEQACMDMAGVILRLGFYMADKEVLLSDWTTESGLCSSYYAHTAIRTWQEMYINLFFD